MTNSVANIINCVCVYMYNYTNEKPCNENHIKTIDILYYRYFVFFPQCYNKNVDIKFSAHDAFLE